MGIIILNIKGIYSPYIQLGDIMVCTFFGHRNAPNEIKPILREKIIELIENKNANMFYVGNNGSFDYMAREILNPLQKSKEKLL